MAAVRPDIVLVALRRDVEGSIRERNRLVEIPSWSFLRSGAVWARDAYALTRRRGPRLVDGIEGMARLFNAPLFSALGSS